MPSDSLHLCPSLCDSSTPPLVTHKHTHTLTLISSLAYLQSSIFLEVQHKANRTNEISLIICDYVSLVCHLGSISFSRKSLGFKILFSNKFSVIVQQTADTCPMKLTAGKWVLLTKGRNRGRKEHLSMSLPSLEYPSVAHPVGADIHAGKQEERVPCLSCCF